MAPAKPTYDSVVIPPRAGSDDGSDLFEEPASKRITMLLCVNTGLLLFACGGLTYLTHGWDPTAFLCTAGYVMCGLGLALPACMGGAEEEKLKEFEPACKGLYTFVGTLLNALGLAMGIVGSLMYSPTVNRVMYRLDEEREFDFMRNFANIIWAISFFLFPVGVGLFLAERKMTLSAYNASVHKPPPSVYDKNLRVLFWSFVMLCVCAVGGVFFCFDEQPGWELTACVLFGVAGCIKVSLLVVEVKEMCEESARGTGGEGTDSSRSSVAGFGGNEGSPLMRGSPIIAPSAHTSDLLGDPTFAKP